jgi:hypothetical protein
MSSRTEIAPRTNQHGFDCRDAQAMTAPGHERLCGLLKRRVCSTVDSRRLCAAAKVGCLGPHADIRQTKIPAHWPALRQFASERKGCRFSLSSPSPPSGQAAGSRKRSPASVREAVLWKIPAIVLTGDIRSHATEAIAQHDVSVLVKPTDADELLQLIRRLHSR